MPKVFLIVLLSALVVGLPFFVRQAPNVNDWRPGDPELVIITPHSEAIRFEFARAFSQWHRERYGQPVKIDWRAVGGATEIMRYLDGAFVASFRGYWQRSGKHWPANASQRLLAVDEPQHNDNVYRAFRRLDDPVQVSANIDVLFGGGEYDHSAAFRRGLTVAPWPAAQAPEGLLTAAGEAMIPTSYSGEVWRTDTLFGTAVSTFGICFNKDRLQELGVAIPLQWDDLANPSLRGQVGVSDPTKSGSIAKAFEMIIQQKIYQALMATGFSDADIDSYERKFEQTKSKPWQLPKGVPVHYQQVVEQGWLQGLALIQRIGANARYFTDSSTKVPVDVSMGNAAVGLSIDFYGRYQAEYSRNADGNERMGFITPVGGSSVSSDPISLLRGAPHRALAIRFMQFVLSDAGQQLWNYRPGEVGGPKKYALRRLPIRRSFYPSNNPLIHQLFVSHQAHFSDQLANPDINPYEVGKRFVYHPRWTGQHFNVHRVLIKAMCLDAGDELKSAWKTIQEHGGTEQNQAAIEAFSRLPDGLNWRSAIDGTTHASQLETVRRWVAHFRHAYLQAEQMAKGVAK